MFFKKSVNLLLMVVVLAALCLCTVGFFQLKAIFSGIRFSYGVNENSKSLKKAYSNSSTVSPSTKEQEGKVAQNAAIPGKTDSQSVQTKDGTAGSGTGKGIPSGSNAAVNKPDATSQENTSMAVQNGQGSSARQNDASVPVLPEKTAGSASQNTQPAPVSNSQSSTAPPAVPKEVESKVGTIAKKQVEAEDYLTAGAIILKKLSPSEIKLLFDQARDDYWVVTPVEDIEKARSILFSKLTAEELETLRAIGKKYGRSMDIINPDINVEETKAKQIAASKKKSGTQTLAP